MYNISIPNYKTKQIVFSGRYSSIKNCIEDAILKGSSLKFADLRYANLANANLDDGDFEGALFKGANLCGANISEANLSHCSLIHANLIGACLCYTNLNHCKMADAQFGATDITGATLDGASFSTLSALMMNFSDVLSMKDCTYLENDKSYRFSKPPIILTGTPQTMVFLDSHLKIGTKIMPYAYWSSATNDNSDRRQLKSPQRHSHTLSTEQKFFHKNRILIEKISKTMRA